MRSFARNVPTDHIQIEVDACRQRNNRLRLDDRDRFLAELPKKSAICSDMLLNVPSETQDRTNLEESRIDLQNCFVAVRHKADHPYPEFQPGILHTPDIQAAFATL